MVDILCIVFVFVFVFCFCFFFFVFLQLSIWSEKKKKITKSNPGNRNVYIKYNYIRFTYTVADIGSLESLQIFLKDWLLDDSLHETFEIRKIFFKINLIDFNPSTHSDNRSPGFPH